MTQRLVELSEPLEPLPGQSGQPQDLSHEDSGMLDNPRAIAARNKMREVCSEMLADMDTGMFGAPDLQSIVKQARDEAEGAEDDISALAVVPATGPAAGSRSGAVDSSGIDLSGDEPTLVVIADFEPPSTHATQMLRLKVGEFVTIVGQDGRGWWYGRLVATGAEGWFPPSYVQVKPAHRSNAEAP